MSTFITNKENNDLKSYLENSINISKELKFLVGFFYFSGISELYDELKKKFINQNNLKIKILVGLQVDKINRKIVELGSNSEDKSEEIQKYLKSVKIGLNNKDLDNKESYEQIDFFINLIQEDKLIIRKTKNPNHAKLYLFEYEEQSLISGKGSFITGSSNLTKAGIKTQDEFDVLIRDYGYEQATEYFENLWNDSIQITEIPEIKQKIIKIINNQTQFAKVSPFEAYAYVLKTYLDTKSNADFKDNEQKIDYLLKENQYTRFQYQIDAVNEALKSIESHNGVIIADVVGLGKSIIASLIASCLNQRGLIICPPGLIPSWESYKEDFMLYNWEIKSRGKLDALEVEKTSSFNVVIIDEAHYFRNNESSNYENLFNICKGKKVILLTATPYNNKPNDIYSLLRLFINTKNSSLLLNGDLDSKFNKFNDLYHDLSFIEKEFNSDKKDNAIKKYNRIFNLKNNKKISLQKVKEKKEAIFNKIKELIKNVVIRRNRIDLKEDEIYKKEITELSNIKDPEELLFELDEKQNYFYDKVIKEYFSKQTGKFKSAIYIPFKYEKQYKAENKLNEQENKIKNQEENLADFMRNLLIKRFESSFRAFSKSINNFLEYHQKVLDIIKPNGIYPYNKKIINKLINQDEDKISEELNKIYKDFINNQNLENHKKKDKIYNINNFQRKEDFLKDIESDIQLFKDIKTELKELKLLENDPKLKKVAEQVQELLKQKPKNNEPLKKIIIFSEYVDTIKHLQENFKIYDFHNRLLVCDGTITQDLQTKLNENFNAQYDKNKQKNDFDVLLTSDKLSEGYNLNRAGIIINYDIPWNPTRVIQRLGRINRIAKKVFENLEIFNLFPTKKGADYVKIREIAAQKIHMIHSALGEDAKFFSIEEELNPSELYDKTNANPQENEQVNFLTEIRNKFEEIKKNHPEVIKKIQNFKNQIKVAKNSDEYSFTLLIRKGNNIFPYIKEKENITFQEYIKYIECDFEEKTQNFSNKFWENYETSKQEIEENIIEKTNRNSILSNKGKLIDNLKVILKNHKDKINDEVFIKNIIQELNNNKIPDKTIKDLSKQELMIDSKEQQINDFIKELYNKINLNLIENTNESNKIINNQEKDVIIAIENIKP